MNRLQKAAAVTAGSVILMAFSALPSMAWQVKIENSTEWALSPTFFARTTDYANQQYFKMTKIASGNTGQAETGALCPCFAYGKVEEWYQCGMRRCMREVDVKSACADPAQGSQCSPVCADITWKAEKRSDGKFYYVVVPSN